MRRKIALTLAGLLAVVGVWWWLRPSALDRLEVIVAELRARGEPHQLLEVRARASDDGTERLEAIVTSFRLTHRWEPRVAIEWFVRWAGDWNSFAWLRDGVETRVIDPFAARTLLDDLLLGEPIDATPSMLLAVRTRLIEVLPHVADGSLEAGAWDAPSAWSRLETAVESFAKGRPLPYAPFQAHAAVDGIELLTPALDLAPSWDPAYDERLRAALEESTNWTWLSNWFRIGRRTKAAQDLARIALAACVMRAEQGVWPATLDDLAPLLGAPVGVNPYTNGPYVMDVTGDALRLNGRRPGDDSDRDSFARRDPLDWFILPDVVEPR